MPTMMHNVFLFIDQPILSQIDSTTLWSLRPKHPTDPTNARPHLLQQAEFLQLPLVVQDEAVTARPPPSQVLLPADVRHRGVQHPSTSPLHT